jgi:hypothetical protein
MTGTSAGGSCSSPSSRTWASRRTIEELTICVFEYEKVTPTTGYTFFSLEDPKAPRPLDTRYSIPEQCNCWQTLIFRRRFYVISGEVLEDPVTAHSALCDCRDLILAGTSRITEDQALNLALLSIYATTPAAIAHRKLNLAPHLPKNMKVTRSLEKKFKKLVKTTPPMEHFIAAKSYLGLVRKVDGFGEESFDVIYTDISFGVIPKPVRDVTLFVGPLMISFNSPTRPIKPIPYRLLMSFESLGQHLVIKFLSDANKVATADLKSPGVPTIHMLIGYNIKIIKNLLDARQRKQKPAAAPRTTA